MIRHHGPRHTAAMPECGGFGIRRLAEALDAGLVVARREPEGLRRETPLAALRLEVHGVALLHLDPFRDDPGAAGSADESATGRGPEEHIRHCPAVWADEPAPIALVEEHDFPSLQSPVHCLPSVGVCV